MKYKTAGNCPYCDAEIGITYAWVMSPEGMKRLKENHDAGHPENEPKTTGKHCPKCGFLLTN